MVADFPQLASYGFNVRRTHRAFDRLLSAMLSRHKIKTGYWYYLRVLWQKDGLTQKEMSTFNNVSENTTAILIGKMMKERLVSRERDREDKRKWIVRLTPRSLRLRTDLLPYASQVNEIASRGISKSDLATCLSVLKRMSANLEQGWREIDPNVAPVDS